MSRTGEPVVPSICTRSRETYLGLRSVVVITKGVKQTGTRHCIERTNRFLHGQPGLRILISQSSVSATLHTFNVRVARIRALPVRLELCIRAFGGAKILTHERSDIHHVRLHFSRIHPFNGGVSRYCWYRNVGSLVLSTDLSLIIESQIFVFLGLRQIHT